jgi:branched-chain amino acid aminotransferase
MKQLGFNIPILFTPQLLEAAILETVQKNKLLSLCRVRLQVYAGSGGLYDIANQQPQYIIECFPLEQPSLIELNENGLVLGIAEGLQKSSDSLANLKTSNALIYAMAARQATANKWNDALICNTCANIIESTIANIFWVKNDIIFTPPLSEGCIAGVMRRHIIARLAKNGIGVQESSLSIDGIDEIDGVFLTNAIRRIKWVQCIGEKSFKMHSITSQLHDILRTHQ